MICIHGAHLVVPFQVTAFCSEALEGQANDLFGDSAMEEDDVQGADSVARVIRLLAEDKTFMNVIKECDWSNWAVNAGEPNLPDCADLDVLFDRISDELQNPYKDLREVFQEIPDTELFYLATSESSDEFTIGSVVRGNVLLGPQQIPSETSFGMPYSNANEYSHQLLCSLSKVSGDVFLSTRKTMKSHR
eukprot:Skav224290  [mRNA]  locus=scaffold2838:109966:114186:- [translate_table: standard]